MLLIFIINVLLITIVVTNSISSILSWGLIYCFLELVGFLFRLFGDMGETCSACNQKDSNTELLTDVHKVPSGKEVMAKEEVNHNEKIMS